MTQCCFRTVGKAAESTNDWKPVSWTLLAQGRHQTGDIWQQILDFGISFSKNTNMILGQAANALKNIGKAQGDEPDTGYSGKLTHKILETK